MDWSDFEKEDFEPAVPRKQAQSDSDYSADFGDWAEKVSYATPEKVRPATRAEKISPATPEKVPPVGRRVSPRVVVEKAPKRKGGVPAYFQHLGKNEVESTKVFHFYGTGISPSLRRVSPAFLRVRGSTIIRRASVSGTQLFEAWSSP
jgi:hypothetical protein